MKSGLNTTSNIYHIKGLGTIKEKINIPNIISVHPILICTNEIPIPLNKDTIKITIQDKNIINENMRQIEALKSNNNHIPSLINPNKEIITKRHQINFSNGDYIQDYEIIKNNEKEKFKELKQKKTKELISLLENDSLGREPYQKLASLL